MFQYPNPSYAAHIWTSGDRVNLILPPATDHNARSHTIHATVNIAALKSIVSQLDEESLEERKSLAAVIGFLQVLKAREDAQRSVEIGKAGAPTQLDLEYMVRQLGVKVQRVGKKSKADNGMTLEDIEL
jgi:hypothetical protein